MGTDHAARGIAPPVRQRQPAPRDSTTTPGQRARLVGDPRQLELQLVPVQPKGTE